MSEGNKFCMDIRTASLDDLNHLSGLVISFRNHFDRTEPTDIEFVEGIKKLMNGEDAQFFMALDVKKAPIGYVLQRYQFNMWSNGTEARIEDLFVDPVCRQGGTGKSLIEYSINRAIEKRCTTMCLDTNENNIASNKIYSQLGFSAVSKNWDNGRQIFYRKSLIQK